jgi:hypothetical protein
VPRTALLLVASVALFLPSVSDAQWRYPPYPSYAYAGAESDLRFSVKPKDAAVYVDGYFAGKVDDFDGTFQRLHVDAGEHEVVVYLAGHHSLKRRLYLSPNSTRKIEGTLEPLAPGDPAEAEPTPSAPPEPGQFERQPPRGSMPRPMPMPGRRTPGPPDQEPPQRPGRSQAEPSRFGTLSIRIQPGDAALIIDGERWAGAGGDDRLIVQVTPGRHKIEAEKDGYTRFVTEIEANRDQTTPVNISMTKLK